jgi:hypothetical protein
MEIEEDADVVGHNEAGSAAVACGEEAKVCIVC